MPSHRLGGSQGSGAQSTTSEFSDSENIDGLGTRICGQGVINKLVGHRVQGSAKPDFSFLGARYSSIPTSPSSLEKSKIPNSLASDPSTTIPSTEKTLSHDRFNTLFSSVSPRSPSSDFTGIDQNQLQNETSSPTKQISSLKVSAAALNRSKLSDQSKIDDRNNPTGPIEEHEDSEVSQDMMAFPESRSHSSLELPPRIQKRIQQEKESQEREQHEREQQAQQLQGLDKDTEQTNHQQPIGFLNSFRTQPWSLTLPSVMEETATYDTEDIGVKSPSQSHVRSPAHHCARSPTSPDQENGDSKQEILQAMKELILKQQDAIKGLSDENLKYRDQVLAYKDEIKKLRTERKESQQRIISLVLEKESFETEAECLKEEVRSLRHAVRDLTISDHEMLQKFESWIDEQGTFGNNPITLSPSQRSTTESEGIVRTNSSSSLSSFDNLDESSGMNKLSFYSSLAKNHSNNPRHQMRNKHGLKSADEDVHGESHEVMLLPQHELQGRDDTDTFNYASDERTRDILVLNEKYGMKSNISNVSNRSASNLSTGTPEWGVRDGSSHDGSSPITRKSGSVASTASSNEEVATFKSRLGSIQRRRMTRQKSKQKPTEVPPVREHSPIVRFF